MLVYPNHINIVAVGIGKFSQLHTGESTGNYKVVFPTSQEHTDN